MPEFPVPALTGHDPRQALDTLAKSEAVLLAKEKALDAEIARLTGELTKTRITLQGVVVSMSSMKDAISNYPDLFKPGETYDGHKPSVLERDERLPGEENFADEIERALNQ